jgi:hypothetical protein
MTIHYPDGTLRNALLLSRKNHTLRATVPGDDDVRTFIHINGASWISEGFDLVNIEFAWQSGEQPRVPKETECVCSKELASSLISVLRAGTHAPGHLPTPPCYSTVT